MIGGVKNVVVVVLVAMCVVCATTAATTESPTSLLVALKQQNLDVLKAAFWEISDPRSPRYGNHMTADEIRHIIGAPEEAVREVSEWLVQHGASVPVKLLATGDYLVAHFPSRTMAINALRAAPVALPHHVELVIRADPAALSLTDDLEAIALGQHAPATAAYPLDKRAASARAQARKLAPDAFGDPNSQRAAYGIPTTERGSAKNNRQMVWGPGTYGFLDSDLASFYKDFAVNETTAYLHHLGFKGVPGGDNFGEATLDTSCISGIGQGITTLVYNSNSSMSTEEGDGFGAALLHFAASLATGSADSLPVTLSISLGSLTYRSCHMLCTSASNNTGYTYKDCWAYMQQQRQVCMFVSQDQTTRTSTEWMKLGARGVSVLAASGDGGSHYSFQPFPNDGLGNLLNQASCAKNFPTYPASDPYVTGVGGTTWNGAPTQPTPWAGSGGGFSWTFPVPDYQKDFVNAYIANSQMPPDTAYAKGNRAYPDVSALSTDVPMVMQGQLLFSGGTSASAPEFSAVISLINDRRLSAGLPPLGFLNPRLYLIAKNHPGEAFYRMSSGNSACNSGGACCPTSTSFPGAEDYDVLTGLGSPLWDGLVKYMASSTL